MNTFKIYDTDQTCPISFVYLDLLLKYYALDYGGWPAGEDGLWRVVVGKCMAATTQSTVCDYDKKDDFSIRILSLIAGTCIDIIKVLNSCNSMFYEYI